MAASSVLSVMGDIEQYIQAGADEEPMRYLIVIEETGTGYSAYSPDLGGCVANGSTREKVEQATREAIEFHLEGLRRDGHSAPAPNAYSTYTDVPA